MLVYSLLSGILIGTCMILPGVSGSVVAIMLGIYEEVIFLINNNENNLIKAKKILPLAIGIIIGVFIFGKILLIFYNKYTFYMMYVFIGLILGSIPILINEINEKKEKINYKYLAISLLLSLIIFLFPKVLNVTSSNTSGNAIILFIGGFLYIAGKIIPGISSSFFLMILGLYDYLLTIITNPFSITLSKFIPFIIGMLLGLYIFVKLMNYLLKKHFSKTYSTIIGFILGSIFAIFPGIKLDEECLISCILMILSYIIVNKLSKK